MGLHQSFMYGGRQPLAECPMNTAPCGLALQGQHGMWGLLAETGMGVAKGDGLYMVLPAR